MGLSVLAATGIGYYIYLKIKQDELNKMISSRAEADAKIDNIDVTGIVIPADANVDPEVPLPTEGFTDYGTLVENNWNNAGGYIYLFNDGSKDFYLSDGVYVGTVDANGKSSF